VRCSGAGLGYQLASVMAGGPAPLIAAWVLSETQSSTLISWYIVGCCVISFIALLLMPRRAEPDKRAIDVRAAQSVGSGRLR
jgi:hypothetical protein